MLIFGIILFLLLSAMFSASEIAFVSSNKLAIELEKSKASRKSKIITNFYKYPQKFLGSMLVGNNIALVVFTSLMTSLFEPILTPYLGQDVLFLLCVTLIITLVVLIFGEFLPKTLAQIYSNQYLNLMSYPLAFFKFILRFPSWMILGSSSFILKHLLKAPVSNIENPITRLDLENFIDKNVNNTDEDTFETELFKNALNLKDVKVRECLIPRNEIIYVDINNSMEQIVQEFKEAGHSRLIVVDGDIENIIGYIHHLSLLEKPKNAKNIIHEITFVPEAMSVRRLLKNFVANNTNMACVVDEFGGTSGIITLEDILEEIFGEIEDEYDGEAYTDLQLNEREFLFSGRLEIDYINEKYENISIPEGEYHTLSGYLVMTAGKIPDEGEEIQLDNIQYIVEEVGDTKIKTIKLILPEETKEDQ